MSVAVSRPEKTLFKDAGVTKADLADYYERVAGVMLPHLRDRPIAMHRFPDGIAGPGFFHKDVPDHFPEWIERARIRKREGGTLSQAVLGEPDDLVYLADQACITPHAWLSRTDRLERPDRLIFDLDPSTDDFGAVRRAARDLGELLEELGLPRFAMTTGSRGVHVLVPLRREREFDEVRAFAGRVADELESSDPASLTTEQRKEKRGDRILIDVMRNAYGQTTVAPYAVRARPGAPVATPLRWEELSDSRLRPDRWTTRSALRRLSTVGDPWSEIEASRASLGPPQRRVERRG